MNIILKIVFYMFARFCVSNYCCNKPMLEIIKTATNFINPSLVWFSLMYYDNIGCPNKSARFKVRAPL